MTIEGSSHDRRRVRDKPATVETKIHQRTVEPNHDLRPSANTSQLQCANSPRCGCCRMLLVGEQQSVGETVLCGSGSRRGSEATKEPCCDEAVLVFAKYFLEVFVAPDRFHRALRAE